jgi:pSer/pThr/pTyr-binding forkhead associated (FHA) protein
LADVSRRHCRFVFTEGSWQVFDLQNLNGVYLNGERVQQAILRHGDVVSLGGYSFQVELGTESPAGEETADGQRSSSAVFRNIAEAFPQPGPVAGYEKRRAS